MSTIKRTRDGSFSNGSGSGDGQLTDSLLEPSTSAVVNNNNNSTNNNNNLGLSGNDTLINSNNNHTHHLLQQQQQQQQGNNTNNIVGGAAAAAAAAAASLLSADAEISRYSWSEESKLAVLRAAVNAEIYSCPYGEREKAYGVALKEFCEHMKSVGEPAPKLTQFKHCIRKMITIHREKRPSSAEPVTEKMRLLDKLCEQQDSKEGGRKRYRRDYIYDHDRHMSDDERGLAVVHNNNNNNGVNNPGVVVAAAAAEGGGGGEGNDVGISPSQLRFPSANNINNNMSTTDRLRAEMFRVQALEELLKEKDARIEVYERQRREEMESFERMRKEDMELRKAELQTLKQCTAELMEFVKAFKSNNTTDK